MPSVGQLIAARAQRDVVFRKEVLRALYKRLAEAAPKTLLWRNLDKTITAFERMKQNDKMPHPKEPSEEDSLRWGIFFVSTPTPMESALFSLPERVGLFRCSRFLG